MDDRLKPLTVLLASERYDIEPRGPGKLALVKAGATETPSLQLLAEMKNQRPAVVAELSNPEKCGRCGRVVFDGPKEFAAFWCDRLLCPFCGPVGGTRDAG